MSWDPIAVVIAVRGVAGASLEEQGGGYNTVDGAGRETWVHNASRAYNQTYVRVGDWEHPHDRSFIADELDRLLCRPPAAG